MIGIYIIALAALLHVGWAVDILLADKVEMTTPTAIYFHLCKTQTGVALMLAVVSLVAMAGKFKWRNGWPAFWTVLPQQIALMLSAWSSFMAVYNAQYSDGVIRSRHFIFDDQWQNIITMLLHSWYVGTLMFGLMVKKFSGDKM